MKFKRHIKLEYGLRQIDIIPLINVVLLLLVFFMLTSGFLQQPGIAVSLPKAVTSDVVKEGNIAIVVSQEGIVYVNGKVLTTQGLRNLLTQAGLRKQPVLIKSDKRASLGKVVEVWDMCRDAGISQVNIATDQE